MANINYGRVCIKSAIKYCHFIFNCSTQFQLSDATCCDDCHDVQRIFCTSIIKAHGSGALFNWLKSLCKHFELIWWHFFSAKNELLLVECVGVSVSVLFWSSKIIFFSNNFVIVFEKIGAKSENEWVILILHFEVAQKSMMQI